MGAVGKRMASVWGLGCLLLYSVISLNFSPIQGVAVRPVYDHYHDREVYQPHHYSYDRGHSHSAVRHVTVVKKRRPRPRVVHRTIIVEEEPLPHVGSVHVVRQPAVRQPPIHVVQQTAVHQPPVHVVQQPAVRQPPVYVVQHAQPQPTVLVSQPPPLVPAVSAASGPRVTQDPYTGRIDPRLIPVLRASTPQQGDPLGIYPGAGLDPRVDPSLVGVARNQLADQVRELSDQLDILTRRLGISSSSPSRSVGDLL